MHTNRPAPWIQSEWEYACRAGTTTDYYWGQNWADIVVSDTTIKANCWYSGNAGIHPNAAGTLLPNAWGLYDMSGNVLEWCNEQYGVSRVFRGGSWGSASFDCCSSLWYYTAPADRSNRFGFRLVRTK